MQKVGGNAVRGRSEHKSFIQLVDDASKANVTRFSQ